MSDSLGYSRVGWLLALLSALNVCVTLESAQHIAADTESAAHDPELGPVEAEDEGPLPGAPSEEEEPESSPPRRVVLQPEIQSGGGRLVNGDGPPRCPLRFAPREELSSQDLLACRCDPPGVGQGDCEAASLAVVARQIQSHAPPWTRAVA